MAVRFIRFDRWGNQLGTIADIREATWSEELNGQDVLSLITSTAINKGDRIVWCDQMGLWHEHIAAEVAMNHEAEPLYTVEAENSISELYGDVVLDKKPRDATAAEALASVLEGTRWNIGSITISGTASTNFYRITCREAVQQIVDLWGGELSTTIEVEGAAVIARKLNLSRRGTDNGRRFTYSRNMEGISRTFIADDVVTALYGFGKGESVGDGYGNGIDFADVNGGKMYVEDLDALEIWGRPDGNGGKSHVFGIAEFSDCDDPEELLELTQAELAERCEPKVSYEASVDAFAEYGYGFDGMGIGDDVALVDTVMQPEVRVKGRATKLVRDLLDNARASDVTIGNIIDDASDLLGGQMADVKDLSSRSTAWDVAAYTPGAYIQQVMDGLNKQFDAGMSYIYQSPEQGIIIGSVPLDPETGRPSTTPASAIQLKGGGFRIANSLKSTGDWNWRTFGTGDGFTADEITAGCIVGGSNYFDLDSGTLYFRQGSITIDGPSNTQVRISASTGFKIYQNGSFIGGLEIVGGKAYLRAARAGISSSLYMTTGQTQQGNPGASFVNSSGNYLDVESLHAVDDPSTKTTGTGMACFNKPFLHASTYYNHLWLHPPMEEDTYLEQPPEQLYLGSSGNKSGTARHVNLQLDSDQGLFMNDSQCILKFDNTHYVIINSSGVQCRCGSRGFGWDDGQFYDTLTWS